MIHHATPALAKRPPWARVWLLAWLLALGMGWVHACHVAWPSAVQHAVATHGGHAHAACTDPDARAPWAGDPQPKVEAPASLALAVTAWPAPRRLIAHDAVPKAGALAAGSYPRVPIVLLRLTL